MKNKDANSLIMTLLSKAPESRLNGSYHSLTKHPFFNGFDWVISSAYLGKIG